MKKFTLNVLFFILIIFWFGGGSYWLVVSPPAEKLNSFGGWTILSVIIGFVFIGGAYYQLNKKDSGPAMTKRSYVILAVFCGIVIGCVLSVIIPAKFLLGAPMVGSEQDALVRQKCAQVYFALTSEPALRGLPKAPQAQDLEAFCDPMTGLHTRIKDLIKATTVEIPLDGGMSNFGEQQFQILMGPWPNDLDYDGFLMIRAQYLETYSKFQKSRLEFETGQIVMLIAAVMLINIIAHSISTLTRYQGIWSKLFVTGLALVLFYAGYWLGWTVAFLGLLYAPVHARSDLDIIFGIGILSQVILWLSMFVTKIAENYYPYSPMRSLARVAFLGRGSVLLVIVLIWVSWNFTLENQWLTIQMSQNAFLLGIIAGAGIVAFLREAEIAIGI